MNIRWKRNRADSTDVNLDSAGVNLDGDDVNSIAMIEVENSIRDLVRNDLPSRRLSEPGYDDDHDTVGYQGSEPVSTSVDAVIQRVAGASLEEIEALITELRGVRDIMYAEGQRVQRELSGYARLSRTAMKSTREIADNVAEWKRAVDELQNA